MSSCGNHLSCLPWQAHREHILLHKACCPPVQNIPSIPVTKSPRQCLKIINVLALNTDQKETFTTVNEFISMSWSLKKKAAQFT